jgi:hypothetical protein
LGWPGDFSELAPGKLPRPKSDDLPLGGYVSKLIDRVAVYSVNESLRSPARCFMPRAQAQELYVSGLAKWNKKGTVLILQKKSAEMFRTARSLNPNERVMFDFVIGKIYAIRIVESWAFAA